ncbi:MAG: efflux RND transporter periplasmic adaptor subunit [Calditrichaeota bacterium]|nr:efflux RND transporter periplasmic adaptor subunit [Calditrichota bacterium]
MIKKTWGVIFLSVVLSGCGSQGGEKQIDVPKSEVNIVKVKVANASVKKIADTREAYGEVKPLKTVDIFSKVNGLVVNKLHRTGDAVKKDDVLAIVRQDIPGMEFAEHKVLATIDGVIIRDAVEEGSTVTVKTPLFSVARLNPVLVEVKAPEEWGTKIKTGTEVNIKLEAFKSKSFTGKVFELLPALDPASRSFVVRIKVKNPQNSLKPGMFARAEFPLGTHQALTIPVDGLIRFGLEYYVFVIKDGIANKRLVQPGRIFGSESEIIKGLSPGEKVVVFGQNLLDEGSQVEVEEVR